MTSAWHFDSVGDAPVSSYSTLGGHQWPFSLSAIDSTRP